MTSSKLYVIILMENMKVAIQNQKYSNPHRYQTVPNIINAIWGYPNNYTLL